jgi:hypothetical protein
MRSRYGGLLVLLVCGATAPGVTALTSAPAAADCVAPTLEVRPRMTFDRGTEVTVEGSSFRDGCNDTGTCSGFLGCQRCDYGPPAQPSQDVVLTLRQAGRTWELAAVDAEADGSVTWSVMLPADAARGPARLVAEGTHPVRIRLR